MNVLGSISNWWSALTGQGSFSDHGSIPSVAYRPARTNAEISELLSHSAIIRTACEARAEDIARAWRKHSKNASFWTDVEERYELRDLVEQILFYAEGYGGAFVFPRYSESEINAAALRNPRITPKSECLGFHVYTQYELRCAPNTEHQRQANGRPMYYVVDGSGSKLPIHYSWFRPVRGPTKVPSPVRGVLSNADLLGQSRVDIIFDDYSRMAAAHGALSHILVKGNIDVLKIKGLAEALSRCDTTEQMHEALQKVVVQASSTVAGANSFQPMVVDSEETLERKAGNHTGAADIVRELKDMFVAATRIPRTRLLGEQSKGLGNGGEADLINYYDGCAAYRERRATGLLNWLDSVVAPGKRTAWEYNPLTELSAAAEAEVAEKRAKTDKVYFEMQVPGVVEAVRERLATDPHYPFKEGEPT